MKMLREFRLKSSLMITRAPRAEYLSRSLKSFDSDALFEVPFKEASRRVGFFADRSHLCRTELFLKVR